MTPLEITTRIIPEHDLRIHRVTGSLTKESLLAKLEEIYSTPGIKEDMNSLWDIRDADLSSFNLAKVQSVRDFVEKHWGTSGRSRSALVVSGESSFLLSRMYELLMESRTKSATHIFQDYEKALRWVKSEA